MNRDLARQTVVVASFLSTLVANGLAATGLLGGLSTEQIATRYPIYFLPANFTFGIWGIIYLSLGAYAVFQALPSQRERPLHRSLGWLVAITGLFNSLWLIAFQNTWFVASMFAMTGLLVTLIVIYRRLDGSRTTGTITDRALVALPFSLYLGWITVATIANAAYVLFDAGWSGFGLVGSAWAIIMLVVATILTLFILGTRTDVAYLLVVVWAFFGVWVRQANTPSVAATAGVASILLLAAAAITLVLRARKGTVRVA
jgi:TspO/MBR family protein